MSKQEAVLTVAFITALFVFAGFVAWLGGHEWVLERSDWNAFWLAVWGLFNIPVALNTKL